MVTINNASINHYLLHDKAVKMTHEKKQQEQNSHPWPKES